MYVYFLCYISIYTFDLRHAQFTHVTTWEQHCYVQSLELHYLDLLREFEPPTPSLAHVVAVLARGIKSHTRLLQGIIDRVLQRLHVLLRALWGNQGCS